MSAQDWINVLVMAMAFSAILIVGGVFAAIVGRLNAPDDDDPPTILIRPPMNPDDGDWKK